MKWITRLSYMQQKLVRKLSENILSGYLNACCKMALVLAPKMFSDLYPIKKLLFKPSSCFVACLRESIVQYCFSL